MPIKALTLVNVSCDRLPLHSPFFILNQVRSDTSPIRAQTSTLVKRHISASRTTPDTAAGVNRSRAPSSPRLTGDWGTLLSRTACATTMTTSILAVNILPIWQDFQVYIS